MAPTLGYWSFRGVVQPIRLLLAYTGEEHEERLYHVGPAPDFDKSGWLNEKFHLGLPFPNLPYYIDGDVKLTQSMTIAKYIGQKHNLVGETDQDKINIDMLQHVANDIMWLGLIRVLVADNYEEERAKYVNGSLPINLDHFSKFLGSNKFFTGEKLTYVDFILYELLYDHSLFAPEVFNKFPNLAQFLERFEAVPAIAKYINSEKYLKTPCFPDYCKWTGK